MSIAIGTPIVSPARTPDRISDRVALDLHAAPAAVALLASRELGVDVRREQRKAGGHALENADESLAVRFACGGEAEHDGGEAAGLGKDASPATRRARFDCNLSPHHWIASWSGEDVRRGDVDHDESGARHPKSLNSTDGSSPGKGSEARSGP